MASRTELKPVTVENARLLYRNFTGKQTPFNDEGKRNFNILLDIQTAEAMDRDGWNIKWMEPKEEGDERLGRVEVAVSFDVKPPRVVMLTSSGRTSLTEDTIDLLDYAEIEVADIVLNPYQWEVGGKTGVKAYLKTLYVTIREDEIERKYRDVTSAGSVEDD